MKSPKSKTLDQVRPGVSARVEAHRLTDSNVVDMLHEMGVCAGEYVEIRHLAPVLKDPIAIRVGNRQIAIRRRLASFIEVSELS